MLPLLYVDDVILTSNQPSHLSSFIHTLSKEFELSDLGSLSYFLSLEATFSPAGMQLSQLKYTLDLLNKFSMTNCKSCLPQCVLNKSQLSAHNGNLLLDTTEYH